VKVLLSSCFHWWNAEAAYAAAVAEGLLRAGHDVRVWTQAGTRNEAELRARGLPLLAGLPPATASPRHWPGLLRALAALNRRERFDVVNVFRSPEFPFHLLAGRGPGAPALVRTRGSARPVRGHWLNRRLYGRWCAGVIAPAQVARRALEDGLGLAPERVRTIYYPVELPPLPPAEVRRARRQALVAELKLPPDGLLLGLVGRIAPEKGHGLLLEALAQVLPRHPWATLLVFAKSYPGEDTDRPLLQARAEALGVAGSVRWLGFRDDMRQVMGCLDVGVVPSVASEIICRVAVEFLAAGTPVVACPTGALGEVVEDGVSGAVARDASPAALAEALEPLLSDRALRERLARGARRRAEERFSQDHFLRETLAAYANARAGRPLGAVP